MRLPQHHFCPKCGIFWSHGDILLCSFQHLEKKENPLFHLTYFIIPPHSLPPSCPHCCQFSNFATGNLLYRSDSEEEQKEVFSNAQNITPEVSAHDVFLKVKQDVILEKVYSYDFRTNAKSVILVTLRTYPFLQLCGNVFEHSRIPYL